MKISEDLANKILDCSLAIKAKFGIDIGFRHPGGCFITKDNDFVIYFKGYYDEKIQDFVYEGEYFVEYNEFEHETEGFLSRFTADLEQRSDKLTDFLIDFNMWIKNGDIIIEEYREFGKYKWKPAGDGRFCIKIQDICSETRFCCYLEEIDDPIIREHIRNTYKE